MRHAKCFKNFKSLNWRQDKNFQKYTLVLVPHAENEKDCNFFAYKSTFSWSKTRV